MPDPSKRCGFSLIESAIVLAVVAAVIGGIWVAAAQVAQYHRINEAASAIIRIVAAARALYPPANYPNMSTTTYVTASAYNAGIFPKNFTYNASPMNVLTSAGFPMNLGLGCWSICPMIQVVFYGAGSATYSSPLTTSDCILLIRRFATLARNTSEFLYIQESTPTNSAYQFYTAPINGGSVSCPDDLNTLSFWFRP